MKLTTPPSTPVDKQLLGDIRSLIEQSRQQLTVTVNSTLTMMHWHIGQRIRNEVLQGERAAYGEQIVSALARQLEADYGRGFSSKNLRHMLRFAEAFPEAGIVSTLSRQLAWSHFLELIYLKDPLQREFYSHMCSQERWSVRLLRERKESMLFERTALSRQPESLIATELATLRESGEITPALLLKDPYVLDFLGLTDRYLEKGLEDAILRELENFLLELGAGFTFVARQKRIQIDNDDFYIDLLFYNRRLKRLVAIDLKLGDFKAEYKGQMELYLRWLAKYEQEPGEAAPLGIILCSGKKQEQIELLELDASGIHVAEYLTELPPKEVLQQKLHDAIAISRARLENRSGEQA
ncbi:putative nuclease YhcG [Candidatus Nitrotoga sp. BS]|uniref:PDDEXK nuclease domain-containing protein n=1 Tax=Candidatus Nitrotoga sp. BS TaxID=2890408 RepID=UPI001EF2465D|nr:PDDEXK nuclease domain-containing protein [Candidatus Nitrotoga sp. BS]CAH1207521.1 putative nuclease YhcG [Candidatus Nitrotoga sp. BS]